MNQTQRVLEIIKTLSQNREVCTQKLSKQFDINQRAIQRDILLVKEFFENSLIATSRGCYRVLNSSTFFNIFKDKNRVEDIKEFFEFLTLFDDNILNIFDNKKFKFIKHIKNDTKQIYHIRDNPIEKLQSTKILEDIKSAIKYQRYIDLVYHEIKERDFKDIKAQKIIYAKGNWYLAAMTKNYKQNSGFKLFRINFIKEIKLKPNQFQRDIEAENFIQNFQSLFTHYIEPNYEVKIKVDKEVARHFISKKHLKSQKIVEEIDGNLIISYQINNDMEIIPLVKTWIPHLKIISPDRLKKRVEDDIKKYLNDII